MTDDMPLDEERSDEDALIECPDDWHESFFDGLWLEVQEHSFDAAQTRELVDAAQEALQLMPGAHVLDVPCGNGRVAIELATRGYRVTGVDRVGSLLETARRIASERKAAATFVEGDMWDLRVDGPFDAALCLWSSIGYGTEADDARFFARTAQALAPGAGLLVETHVVETLLPWFEPHGARWAGDVAVSETRDFDPVRGRILTEWVLSGPDRRERKVSSLRLYTYRELVRLLEAQGFEVTDAFGSPDLEPFEMGSPRLLLAARRR